MPRRIADIPSPLELFERFRSRFEIVTLELATCQEKFHSHSQLSFRLSRPAGFGYDRRRKRMSTHGEVLVDITKTDLKFSHEVDCSKGHLYSYLFDRVAREVQEKLLAKRVFRLRPKTSFEEVSYLAEDHRAIVIDVNDGPVPWLTVASGGGNWNEFVPPETPEAKAINAALAVYNKCTDVDRMLAIELDVARAALEAVPA